MIRFLLALGLLAVGLPATQAAPDDPAVVMGIVDVREGKLPPDCRVRATPVLGGPPVETPLADGSTFAFEGLPTGLYRFEIVQANNIVFAEAGSPETRVEPGPNNLTLLVQRGRVSRSQARSAADSPEPGRYRVWIVAGGVVAAAVVCESAGCFDDDPPVSPSQPD